MFEAMVTRQAGGNASCALTGRQGSVAEMDHTASLLNAKSEFDSFLFAQVAKINEAPW